MKNEIITEFRNKANLKIKELNATISDYRVKSQMINRFIEGLREEKIDKLIKDKELFSEELLSNVLTIYYSSYVVMLESRNRVWPYEYMAFARRIGELWEPFCKLPFYFPIRKDVMMYDPLSFAMFQEDIKKEVKDYINSLSLTSEEKSNLLGKYSFVWSIVDSGNINLSLDLHIKINDEYYDIDYKSGFSSNEKGNTNRLLLVGSIFHSINEKHHTLLFVRQKEEENNHYLTRLSNSKYWEVYCSDDAYKKIEELSGFNLKKWISENIDWENDITPEFKEHLKNNQLLGYLTW